ncbi:hypothetical protein BCE_4606 [Bacillus cereus ATCC 10987]|uniref:Uncharacterized protein n=1 Tax=Bacillus cereus (strain ATCC 10987 / NRS 248) TaxID=222523 RepID=Q72ZR2_BACC1|nr:hypothetical protein BCE_4606 [Bacillus cereus ATCC 10987]
MQRKTDFSFKYQRLFQKSPVESTQLAFLYYENTKLGQAVFRF